MKHRSVRMPGRGKNAENERKNIDAKLSEARYARIRHSTRPQAELTVGKLGNFGKSERGRATYMAHTRLKQENRQEKCIGRDSHLGAVDRRHSSSRAIGSTDRMRKVARRQTTRRPTPDRCLRSKACIEAEIARLHMPRTHLGRGVAPERQGRGMPHRSRGQERGEDEGREGQAGRTETTGTAAGNRKSVEWQGRAACRQ